MPTTAGKKNWRMYIYNTLKIAQYIRESTVLLRGKRTAAAALTGCVAQVLLARGTHSSTIIPHRPSKVQCGSQVSVLYLAGGDKPNRLYQMCAWCSSMVHWELRESTEEQEYYKLLIILPCHDARVATCIAL